MGAVALDDWTLQLTLENPTPYFLELLNHYMRIVGFLLIRQPLRNLVHLRNKAPHGLDPGNYVGNGPFVLTDHRVNSVIEVQKNPQYWDSETVKLNAIRFYPIEN